MADDKTDLDKRRRDLYAVSLGLLAFNLAGGILRQDPSIASGAIDIHRTWVLQFGAWAAWAYFFWQFWLVARPLWKGFDADVDCEIQISRLFQSYCKRLFELIAEVALSDQGARSFPNRNRHDLEEAAKAMGASAKKKYTFKIEEGSSARRFVRETCVREDLALIKQSVHISDGLWEHVLAKHQWKASMRMRALWIGRIKAAWRRQEFSTRILPLLIACVAPLAGFARFGWHLYRS